MHPLKSLLYSTPNVPCMTMVERVGFSPTRRSPLIYLDNNEFAASVTNMTPQNMLLALIELPLQKLVWATGFEPATPCSQSKHSTKLSYTQIKFLKSTEEGSKLATILCQGGLTFLQDYDYAGLFVETSTF